MLLWFIELYMKHFIVCTLLNYCQNYWIPVSKIKWTLAYSPTSYHLVFNQNHKWFEFCVTKCPSMCLSIDWAHQEYKRINQIGYGEAVVCDVHQGRTLNATIIYYMKIAKFQLKHFKWQLVLVEKFKKGISISVWFINP